MTKKVLTLCIIHQHNRVLLGMKKRGFGGGRWNGFGGKVLENEGIEDATRRETLEEAGIILHDIEKVGILEFGFRSPIRRPSAIRPLAEALEVHIFKATEVSGEPIETEEMRPHWFEISEIPYNTMWPDDIFWLPLFLKGKRFTGRFLFGKGDIILEQSLLEEYVDSGSSLPAGQAGPDNLGLAVDLQTIYH